MVCPAWAQLDVRLETPKTAYLQYSQIPFTICLKNIGGEEITLESYGGKPWLEMLVQSRDGLLIREEKSFSPPDKKLKGGESTFLPLDLAAYFLVRETGGYQARASVRLPSGRTLLTEPLDFIIGRGEVIWNQTRGEGLDRHVYSLLKFYEDPNVGLYLRVEIPDRNIVYPSRRLGPYLPLTKPTVEFDNQNQDVRNIGTLPSYLVNQDPRNQQLLSRNEVIQQLNEINNKLYKFYVSDDKFKRLVESQSFYFDGLSINKPNLDILNFFDDKFSFDAYRSSYDTLTGKSLRKVIVQLSTAAENLRTINVTDPSYSNSLLNNTTPASPSIDVMITPGEDFNTFEILVGQDVYLYDLTSFSSSANWGTPATPETPASVQWDIDGGSVPGATTTVWILKIFDGTSMIQISSPYTILPGPNGAAIATAIVANVISYGAWSGSISNIGAVITLTAPVGQGSSFNTVDFIVSADLGAGFSDYSFNFAGGVDSSGQGLFSIIIDETPYNFLSELDFDEIYNQINAIGIGTWTHTGPNFEVQGQFIFDAINFEDLDGKLYVVLPTQNITTAISQSSNVLDINRAYIIDSDFKSGIFQSSTWISGNYMNYNLDHTLEVQNDYIPASIDSTNGRLSLYLGQSNRRRILRESEVVFFNRLELDSTLLGYDNLVRLPDVYKIEYIDQTNNLIILEDFINGTNSVFYSFTQSFNNRPILTTRFAENAYLYAHPVKFVKSKIKSGIFRRAYFESTNFDNPQFDTTERDSLTSNYDNWRRLIVSESIFSDNLNSFDNGLLLYSHWLAGSDDWRNGIVQNSIWNSQSYTFSYGLTSSTSLVPVNIFKNGIFRQSRWVNGIFGDGLFYRNNSNNLYTTQVYADETTGFYRKKNDLGQTKTRWAWLNGTFRNGIFELSHFENGLFEDGQFFNSTFLDGVATGGIFGKTNLNFNLTRVSAGTFSNLRVLNANFSAESPDAQLDSYFNIEWLNGIFDNGVFGVKVVSGSYSTEKLTF